METNKNTKLDFIIGWLFVAVVAFIAALSLGGCNTVRGVAQAVKGVAADIEAAADGIQHQMAETDK